MSRRPAYAQAAFALWRLPRATREELLAYQSRALRRLVAHAYRRVPYYRELFDAHGVRPGEIRTAADLRRIPLTTRGDLQRQPLRALVASGYRPERLLRSLTSGSTGQPFEIREAWLEQHLHYLFRRRGQGAQGLRTGDRVVTLGRPVPPGGDRHKWVGRLLERCGMPRIRRIDALQEPDRILAELRELRPNVLSGYSGALARVAGAVGEADRRAIPVRLIFSGGEVLTPAMRDRIQTAWGAPAFESYACHECNLIGWECGVTGDLHACEDANVVEVLKDGAPVAAGESGEIVLTSLHFYAMPFLRYRPGDVVTRGDSACACGAPFATLRAVQGRVVETLTLADGRRLHPFQLIRAFKYAGLGWLGEFQIAQRDATTIDLTFVPYAAPPSDALEQVRASLAAAVGTGVRVNVQMAKEIPPAPSGKRAQLPVYGARAHRDGSPRSALAGPERA